jgi:flagellar operon protein
MNHINKNYTSIEQVAGQFLNKPSTSTGKVNVSSQKSFQEILEQQRLASSGTELKFSKHASERLTSRNIDLSASQLSRLESGAKMANEKGIKESLVMVDNMAFIVNVKNNTVVTAVNDGEDRVFTNIDGAVII